MRFHLTKGAVQGKTVTSLESLSAASNRVARNFPRPSSPFGHLAGNQLQTLHSELHKFDSICFARIGTLDNVLCQLKLLSKIAMLINHFSFAFLTPNECNNVRLRRSSACPEQPEF
jgi:hypothetical protein